MNPSQSALSFAEQGHLAQLDGLRSVLNRLVSANVNRRHQLIRMRQKQVRTAKLMRRSHSGTHEQFRHRINRLEQAIRELKSRRVLSRSAIRTIRAQVRDMDSVPIQPRELLSPHDPARYARRSFRNAAVQTLA